MIRILIDSSSDYRPEDAAKKGIDVVALIVGLGDREYRDGDNIEPDFFYETIEATGTTPRTSQLTPLVFSDYFRTAKEAGDEVIYLSLDSHLSGTYETSLMAVNLADAQDCVHVVDSTTATTCIRILADHAADLRDAGKTADEIVATLNDVKQRVRCRAGLDTLDYLARGGRLPKAAATAASMANVKPTIVLQGEGVSLGGVGMGMNRAISGVAKAVQKDGVDPAFPLYLIYSYGTENTEKFGQKLAKAGIEAAGTYQIGCTIGAHIGPNAFGCVYVARV